jgi:phospholipase/lecithinase/hemolysin
MNYKGLQYRGVQRVAQIAIASAAFALLAACGGGDDNNSSSSTPPGGVKLQVVSFGDSLSDVGTYAPVIQQSFGGGRFTTNPGEVWTQKVAEYYGGTLTAAYVGGFGQPLRSAGGFGYAQGGSDVTVAQGNGWAPNNAAATTWPVTQQVATYLQDHSSFNSNQLVLINGGANDILQQLQTVLTAIATNLAGNTSPTPAQVQAAVIASTGSLQLVAQQLGGQVATILGKGATHVAVMNVPDIGKTPLAAGLVKTFGPQVPTLISAVVAVYNGALLQTLQGLGIANKVVYVDASAWITTLLGNYQAQGFTNGTGTGCDITLMAQNATAYATANPSVLNGLTPAQYGAQFGSSLFCSPQTYTVAGADQTYIFADSIHPTTHAHALFAQTVQQALAASGVGK